MSRLPTELVKEILLILPILVLKKSYLIREMHGIMNSSSFWEQRRDSLYELMPLDFPPTFEHMKRLVRGVKFGYGMSCYLMGKRFIIYLSTSEPNLLNNLYKVYQLICDKEEDYIYDVLVRYVKVLPDRQLMDLQVEIYACYRDNIKEVLECRSNDMQILDMSKINNLNHVKIVQEEINLRLKN